MLVEMTQQPTYDPAQNNMHSNENAYMLIHSSLVFEILILVLLPATIIIFQIKQSHRISNMGTEFQPEVHGPGFTRLCCST